jgi:hypothetical protein
VLPVIVGGFRHVDLLHIAIRSATSSPDEAHDRDRLRRGHKALCEEYQPYLVLTRPDDARDTLPPGEGSISFKENTGVILPVDGGYMIV